MQLSINSVPRLDRLNGSQQSMDPACSANNIPAAEQIPWNESKTEKIKVGSIANWDWKWFVRILDVTIHDKGTWKGKEIQRKALPFNLFSHRSEEREENLNT